MAETDGVYGYFGDFPYFNPLKVKLFYSIVQSSHIHKLHDNLMTFSRNLNYFVDKESSLGKKVSDYNKSEKLNCFPSFNKISPVSSIYHTNGSCFVSIHYSSSRLCSGTSFDEVQLDHNGIDLIWTSWIRYLFGELPVPPRFVILNCDLFLNDPNGSFILSIFLLGISSILHSFKGLHGFNDRLNNITLGLHVIDSYYGRVAGDSIHLYVENRLRISVANIPPTLNTVSISSIIKSDSIIQCESVLSWREEIRALTVDWFEELCDASSSSGKSDVILLVLPDAFDSSAIRAEILDSYTTIPTRVVEVEKLIEDSTILFTATPLIVVCSSSWVIKQQITTGINRIISKINVTRVIHCGFIENAQNIEEEIINTATGVLNQITEAGCFALVKHDGQFIETKNSELSIDLGMEEIYLPDTLLLIYRRFLLPYTPETHQPRLSLPENCFINSTAYKQFYSLIKNLEMAGAAKWVVESSELVLQPMGRFLSYAFFYRENYSHQKRISVLDAKILLWSFILRQSKQFVISMIQDNHPQCEWVVEDIDSFCHTHGIGYQKNAEFDNKSLILHLASYGFRCLKENNRLHFLLSLPFGRRQKVQNHFLKTVPSTCRGWSYGNLPGDIVTAQVLSYPISTMFCELTESLSISHEKAIQCPLEVSYPLLVARTILHIALHNNCIFIESTDGTKPIPMPFEILRCNTISSILGLDDVKENNSWIDNAIAGGPRIYSNASLFDPIRYKGGFFNFVLTLGRSGRKRERPEEKPQTDLPTNSEFTGKKPQNDRDDRFIRDFVSLISENGREKVEKEYRSNKLCGFLNPTNELYPYYIHLLEKSQVNRI